MPAWMSALANAIIFVFSIWFSRFHDLSELWHWLLMAIAVVLVMWITAAKEVKADRQARQQASFHQFNVDVLTEVREAIGRIENREHQEAVAKAVGDYYEEIVKTVGEAKILDELSAVATSGHFASSGSVRDLIPKP